MRFICENCLAQYMIKDEKIKRIGVKVRCKKCSHIMTVRRPESELDLLSEEATIRMPLPEEEDEESFFMDALVQSGEMPLSSLGTFGEAKEKALEDDWASPAASSSPPADLGSLFDDPELKAPSAGFFGALDDEELGDAFERAISQRQTPSLQTAAGALSAEPSIVVSQGLSQAVVEWFVAVEDSQVGPLDMNGMKSHWQQGRIGKDSLCWKSGMRDWMPIAAVEGLFEQLSMLSTATVPSAEFSLSSESPASPLEWQPSAASALASLVQDELHGMTASPPPLVSPAEAAPHMTGTAAALADIPLAPAPTPAPAYGVPLAPTPAPAYAASLSMPPAPSATAAHAPIYLPPAPPPSHNNKAMWAMAIALGVVAVAVVVMLVVFVRSPEPPSTTVAQAPPPVQVPPLPAPPPVVVETLPAAPVPDAPQADASDVLAQQLLPPTPRPSKTTPRAPKSDAVASAPRGGSAPAAASPPSSSRVQDDFERAFGGAASESAPTKSQGAQKTVYVPPAPGAGAAKQSLSDADIMEYILGRRAEVASCAREQKSKNPNVKGAMVVEWNIAPSGKTSQVKLAAAASEFQGTHFADCVIKLIQGWQFPAHRTAGGTRKFNFRI